MRNEDITSTSWPINIYKKLQFNHLSLLSLVAVLVFLTSQCTQIEELFQEQSPRDSYQNALQSSPLSDNRIWHQWITAGDSAISKSVLIDPPFQQKILYFSDEPYAWGWKLHVMAGRRLEFVCVSADTSHRLFIDLFSVKEDGIQYIKSTKDTSLIYEVKEKETLLLRLQPELLISGQATFFVKDYPTLGFPVKGGRQSDIGSYWGDPRDAGARKHEGVDIFAPHGTPVIAASDGRISKTGNGGLGGKTIWLRTGSKSLYYAHLDSINVRSGQSVEAGDTIGFVGNTGNARTTPAHLHFGIYRRGAINPLPFVEDPGDRLPALGIEVNQKDHLGRITTSVANVRPVPSIALPPVASLKRNDVIGIRGVTNGWYEVVLPDETSGFIHKSLLSTALTPLNDMVISVGDSIVYPIGSTRAILSDDQTLDLKNYGSFGRFMVSRFQGHWVGVCHIGLH